MSQLLSQLLRDLGGVRINQQRIRGLQTFKNEDPSPASIPTDSIHVGDCVGEQARECSCYDGSAEEEVYSPLEFMAFIV